MSARYRIVHFTPDPFSGSKIPVAALVESGGRWELTRALHVPGPGCLGGLRSYSAMQLAVEALAQGLNGDRLPMTAGPQLELDQAREIPAGAFEPVEWVRSFILPRRSQEPADRQEAPPKAPQRQRAGFRFFETHRVAKFVKRRFQPQMIPGVSALAVSDVAHYVRGRDDLLLMEPLLATRNQFEEDLTHVSESILAWQRLFEIRRPVQTPLFIVYLLRASEVAIEEARRTLAPSRCTVISVDHEIQRINFIETIRKVGATGSSQNQLM